MRAMLRALSTLRDEQLRREAMEEELRALRAALQHQQSSTNEKLDGQEWMLKMQQHQAEVRHTELEESLALERELRGLALEDAEHQRRQKAVLQEHVEQLEQRVEHLLARKKSVVVVVVRRPSSSSSSVVIVIVRRRRRPSSVVRRPSSSSSVLCRCRRRHRRRRRHRCQPKKLRKK